MKKKNTWNIRRLIDDSFVPSARRTSVLNCKSLDFRSWPGFFEQSSFVSLYCTVIRAYNWRTDQKSVNLEYNTLVRWTHETNVLLTKRLMFQVFFFFIKSCKILCKNIFIFFFNFLYKITKMKQNTSEHPKPMTNNEKKNTWNVKHLVENLFVPSA